MTLYFTAGPETYLTAGPQTKGIDCGGPIAERVIVYNGGIAPRYDKLVQMLRVTSLGTPLEGFYRVFDYVKLRHELRTDMPLEEMFGFVDDGITVILMMQGWKNWEGNPPDWKNKWKSGHFAVPVDYNRQRIYFADPWKDPDDWKEPHKNRRFKEGLSFLYRSEFRDMWHDEDTDGTRYYDTGLIVYPKKKIIRPRRIRHMGYDYRKK